MCRDTESKTEVAGRERGNFNREGRSERERERPRQRRGRFERERDRFERSF